MTARRGWLAVAAALPLCAQQPDFAASLFVRTEVATREPVVGQAVAVRVVVGVERQAVQQHAVQLFLQQLDLPVQVTAPWLDGQDGLARVESAGVATEAPSTLALHGAVTNARALPDETHAGRTFTVVAIDRVLRPLTSGAHTLAPARAAAAFATAFRDDFVHGRVAVDRQDVAAAAEPVELRVRDLPATGRPIDFRGAVGMFAVRASARPTELAVGETLQLELEITGDGDLRALAPPPLALPDFHVLGVLDRGGTAARTLVYEISPLAVVAAVPPVVFSFFVPGDDGGYRTVATAPLPLQVRPSAVAAEPAPARRLPTMAAELVDIRTAPLPADQRALSDALVIAMLASPWLVAMGWIAARRRGLAVRPVVVRTAVVDDFVAAAERRDVDLLAHFDAWLAARLGTAAGGRELDIAASLHARGVDHDLAQRAARLQKTLAAARYAGISAGVAAAAQQLVREIDRVLTSADAT